MEEPGGEEERGGRSVIGIRRNMGGKEGRGKRGEGRG